MYKTTLQIGILRNKKFLKVVKAIQKQFPQYQLIIEVESRGWFSITYSVWVRDIYHISNVRYMIENRMEN